MNHASPAEESHEAFEARVARVFLPEETSVWSRFERALFNSLMSRLIFSHRYEDITEGMLLDARLEMKRVMARYGKSGISGP